MIALALAAWLLFTLGIAVERSWARRTGLFIGLWLAMTLLLALGYGIAGLAGWF